MTGIRGWLLALTLVPPGALDVPQFADRAREAGLSVTTYCGGPTKDHILESTGAGVLVLDYDRDGWMDLYVVNAHRFVGNKKSEPHSSVLYRNLGDGTFEDRTAKAGVATSVFGQGGAVGDVDGDGLPDLYVTAFGDNILFRNNGDGTFTDWTDKAGVNAPGWSIAASFFDAEGDGDPDLFVASYIEASWEDVFSARRTRRWRDKVDVLDGPRGLPGARNVFYRNQGDGTFVEATEEAGLAEGSRYYSMGVLTLDYDRDGDTDLYVANDSTPNALYRNRGDGSFEEVGVLTGAAYSADGQSQGSMGIDAADVDGDGYLDLAVTNFAHDNYSLYRNLGGELFVDDSFAAGIALVSFAPLGWGTLFVDVDHDGDRDLIFTNGQIYPQVDDDPTLGESYRQTNQLLLHRNGRFHDVTGKAGEGFRVRHSSRGAAYGDFDEDGDLDVVVWNQDQSPTYLVNQGSSDGHWVSFELTGTSSERMALGASVEITAASTRGLREVRSGGSYASHSDLRLHFGLGDAELVDRVEVRWPDGSLETHRHLPADRRYVLKQGVEPWPLPR